MVLAEHALRCSLAASLAYLSPTQLGAARKEWRHTGPFYAADPGQGYASRLAGAGLAYAEQVLEPSLAASATIFQSPDGEEACVAFRGSTSVSNFRSMFALGLVPCDLDGASGGLVHEGYQEASLRLYERLRPALDRLAAKRVVFTGHSFGGGTATLFRDVRGPTAANPEVALPGHTSGILDCEEQRSVVHGDPGRG